MSNPSASSKTPNNNLPILLLLLVLLLIFASPYLVWVLLPSRDLPGLIVDKTVPDHTYREHNGLIWALNYYKVQPPESEADAWRKAQDYIGFYPAPKPVFSAKNPGEGVELSTEPLQGKQWLYVTDTYGVYHQDVENAAAYEKRQELEGLPFSNTEAQTPLLSPDYSPHIYGGTQHAEIDALEAFAQRGGHVIGEFNLFASPTKAAERERLETFFGVRWTGWTGRFFVKLENEEEVPVWARENYLRAYGIPWDFSGKGWLFVHEDGRIGVLEEDERSERKTVERDVPPQALKIYLTQPQDDLLNGVYDKVPYTYWFDIIEAEPAQVLAEYGFEAHNKGAERLKALGIPLRFPFMVKSSSEPLRMYVAGDASDRDQDATIYQLKGRLSWERFGRFKESQDSQEAFFWEFYLPWIGNVLDHVATRPCVEC